MVTFPANYYNRFDPALRYKMLLFRAARGLQSAEMNEIHSTLHYEFQTFGNVLFADGSILAGGKVSATDSTGDYTVGQTLFWARGYTQTVAQFAFNIAPTESVVVGVAIVEDVVDETMDPNLRDPAVNTRNFNEPGAYRLRSTAQWCKAADAPAGSYFYGVVTFQNGVQVTSNVPAPDLTAAQDLIARYDYGAHGSYILNGMVVSYLYDDAVNGNHVFSVSAGTAHVRGYEQVLNFAQKVTVPFATQTRTIVNEPVTYTAAGLYVLRWNPVASIASVQGIIQVVTPSTFTHGSYNGVKDLLPNQGVTSILAANQGGTWNASTNSFTGGTNYVVGSDFIQNGDYIDWSPSGNEPSPGSAYTVVFQYSLTTANVPVSSSGQGFNASGYVPGSVMYVTYAQYLTRVDILTINTSTQLSDVMGVPDYLSPQAPSSGLDLEIATLTLNHGATPGVVNDGIRAYRFSDIASLKAQQGQNTYNIARLSLLQTLTSTDPTTLKKGTFVDPMTNDTYRDAGIAQTAATGENGLVPSIVWTTTVLNSGPQITLPYSEVTEISQPLYTGSRLVNGYSVTAPAQAIVNLSPASYGFYVAGTLSGIVYDPSFHDAEWPLYNHPYYVVNSGQSLAVATPIPVPSFPLTVLATRFNAGELVDISIGGTYWITVTADATGAVNVTQATPGSLYTGAQQVSVVGRTTGVSGGAVLNSTAYTPVLIGHYYDPLAETFTPSHNITVSSVDLQFTNAGTTYLDVFIMQTTVGQPDYTKVLVQQRIYPGQVNVGGVTRVEFPKLFPLTAGVEYAVVVGCADATAAVRTATLGGYDTVHGRYVSTNPFGSGVLLASSNLKTWTAFQAEDLTFNINRAQFQTSAYSQPLSVATVTNCTDLLLYAKYDQFPGTTVSFTAVLTGRNNETYVLTPGLATSIPSYTGPVQVYVNMTTTDAAQSPIVQGDITLIWGVCQFPDTYVSRAVPINSAASAFTFYMDIYEPNGVQVVVEYLNAAGTAFVAMTRNSAAATPLGAGWVTMQWTATFGVGALAATRFRVTLNSTSSTYRPGSRNLTVYWS